MEALFKVLVAIGGTTISYLYGGWSSLLAVLLTFIAIDYITGFIASAVERKLSSSVGLIGIAKKIAIFAIVAVGHLADTVIGSDGHLIRDAAIFFYMANEMLSITENVGRVGLPLPDILSQAVEVLKNKGKGER